MKRYLVFSFIEYDASGGWHDFLFDADSIDEAKAKAQQIEYKNEFWQIVDTLDKGLMNGQTPWKARVLDQSAPIQWDEWESFK